MLIIQKEYVTLKVVTEEREKELINDEVDDGSSTNKINLQQK